MHDDEPMAGASQPGPSSGTFVHAEAAHGIKRDAELTLDDLAQAQPLCDAEVEDTTSREGSILDLMETLNLEAEHEGPEVHEEHDTLLDDGNWCPRSWTAKGYLGELREQEESLKI